MLFSVVAESIYIPTNSARGFPFLHTLSSIYDLYIFLRELKKSNQRPKREQSPNSSKKL